ncbi:hypothetical protein GY45DRAFT_142678 [Cubamyces sp. BRFM 1775]|nr:hypothetical protein GY45DRAFT_142678 [Cubamyces sp. BRFM 1775]
MQSGGNQRLCLSTVKYPGTAGKLGRSRRVMNFAGSPLYNGLLQTPPPWLRDAVRDMRARYPNDAFDVVGRLALNPSTGGHVTIFNLVCGDCPGEVRSVYIV